MNFTLSMENMNLSFHHVEDILRTIGNMIHLNSLFLNLSINNLKSETIYWLAENLSNLRQL